MCLYPMPLLLLWSRNQGSETASAEELVRVLAEGTAALLLGVMDHFI